MDANIYRVFRNIISDEGSTKAVPDFIVLGYLDNAIDKLSELTTYIFKETKNVTADDITNGYFLLSHGIQQVIEDCPLMESERDVSWAYGGGKKIRMIDSSAFAVGPLDFTYRAKYTKFEGVVKSQDDMDLPNESEMAVVLYALSLYIQSEVVPEAGSNTVGRIKAKTDDVVRVEYGFDSSGFGDAMNPTQLMNKAIGMMRNGLNSQDLFASVQI
jgi:hypothetical protein